MATLYVEEYQLAGSDGNGDKLPIVGGLVTAQKVAIASAANSGTATNSFTKFVALTSDVACQFAFGSSPTADADSRYLPADVPRIYAIKPGHKISVIEQQ